MSLRLILDIRASVFVISVIYAAYALAFAFGGVLITTGQADAGVVVNVFLAILISSFSLAMLNPEVQAIGNARGAAGKLFETIDRVPSIDSLSEEGLRPDHVEGVIDFEVSPCTHSS